MNRKLIGCLIFFSISIFAKGQDTSPGIYKLSKEYLAGEGLDFIKQKDTTRTVYQKKVFDGVDLAVYMVAIGTGITNEFGNFPLEEFIFWMNGKAVVEPVGEEPFPIFTGDYFIQAKGFQGKWNFIDIGGPHLELALVAKNRPDSTFKSPMSRALVIDRDIISGVAKPLNGQIYEGPEITVNLLTSEEVLTSSSQERMIHVLSGVLSFKSGNEEYRLYAGDFFFLPENIEGEWSCESIQGLRVIEVYKTRIENY